MCVGQYVNAANHMAINADKSLASVAYRGHPLSAFEVDGPNHIGHLYMKDANYRGEVTEAIWHPHEPHLFGIYTTGQIFKWLPYEDEVDERSIGANRLIMSRDGNLLAAGDVKGVLRVYTTSGLACIYEVAAQDTVLGLAFSPDLRRLYDLRGFYGNAWEPNVLLKYVDMEGSGSGTAEDIERISHHSENAVNVMRWIDPIAAIACSPTGQFYCSGTSKGTVRIHDATQNTIHEIYKTQSRLHIAQIAWSADGKTICFADSGGRLFVVDRNPVSDSGDRFTMPNAQTTIPDAPVLQVLFNPDSKIVLVQTRSYIHLISTTDFVLVKTTYFEGSHCKWIIHPSDNALLLGFSTQVAYILDWELNVRQRLVLDYTRSEEDSVDVVLATQDRRQILLQLSSSLSTMRDSTYLTIPTEELLEVPQALEKSIKPSILPDAFSEIALALGFLSQNRLIFLSKSFEVCSWQLPATTFGIGGGLHGPLLPSGPTRGSSRAIATGSNRRTGLGTEIFALPGDWISRDCWVLSCLWYKEGAFLCPRNGEVAVVKCASLR